MRVSVAVTCGCVGGFGADVCRIGYARADAHGLWTRSRDDGEPGSEMLPRQRCQIKVRIPLLPRSDI